MRPHRHLPRRLLAFVLAAAAVVSGGVNEPSDTQSPSGGEAADVPGLGALAIGPKSASSTPGKIIWSAGMEDGTTGEWSRDGGGGLFNSGSWETAVVDDQSHSGGRSLKATIMAPEESGVRAFRWKESRVNREAYYSAWLYFPRQYTLTGDPSRRHLNLMQFKSRSADGTRNDPTWSFGGKTQPDGTLAFSAGWGSGGTQVAGPHSTSDVGGKSFEPSIPMTIPVGRWFHMEAFLRQSKDFDGTVQLWVDGTKLYDFQGVRTSYDNCTHNSWCANNGWSVNLYSDGLTPSPAELYIDDAAVARSRLGPLNGQVGNKLRLSV